MKKARKNIAGLLGIALVLAASSAFALTWSAPVTIGSVDIETTGSGTTVWLNPLPAVSICGTNAQVELKGSADTVKTMTSAALAIYLSGKQAKLLLDGSCDGTYANVVGIATL